jgi:hypothetical protein
MWRVQPINYVDVLCEKILELGIRQAAMPRGCLAR